MSDLHSPTERQNIAFRSQSVESMTPEQQQEFIDTLCNQEITNPSVQHRTIVRMLAINHVQMQRLIDQLNKRNAKIQCWFMVLAIGSIIVGAIGATAQVLATLKAFGVLVR